MRIVRAADYRKMPWKNGGGVTREVALAPAPASLSDAPFLWRISLATIRASGPFSPFPGIDRTIVALSGNSINLWADGHHAACLDALGEPFAFPGEAEIDARIDEGETTDLNIMTLRGHAGHEMERLAWSGKLAVTGRHATTAIIATSPVTLVDAEGRHDLAAEDTILDIDLGEELVMETAEPAVAYRIGIDIR